MKPKLKVGDLIRITKLPGTLKDHKYLLPTHLEKIFKSLVRKKTSLEVDAITNDTVWLKYFHLPNKFHTNLNIDINEKIWKKVK